MRRLSIIVLLLSVGGLFSPLARARNGEFTIVLFGASWCPPCIGEVRALPQIAAAAQGDRIVVAWIDGNLRDLRITRPANVEFASTEAARGLWALHGRAAAGLPYSVMLDASGRRCARWSRPLGAEAIAAMRAACESGAGTTL